MDGLDTEGLTVTPRWAIAALGVTSLCVIAQPLARADSPKFPDLDAFTPVDIADYLIDTTSPGHPSSGTYFVTPEGVVCNFTSLQVQCRSNNFPSIPPAVSDPVRNLNRINWIGTVTGLKQTNEGPVGTTVHGQLLKTLPPLHSISVFGATCGVDDAGTTSCKDSNGHGFILSPTWSGWLPHV